MTPLPPGTDGHIQPSSMAQAVQQYDLATLDPTISLTQAQHSFFLTSNQSHDNLLWGLWNHCFRCLLQELRRLEYSHRLHRGLLLQEHLPRRLLFNPCRQMLPHLQLLLPLRMLLHL